MHPENVAVILAEQRKKHERRILSGKENSFRGIRSPTFTELGIDMVEKVRGKVVGDMGSGRGGLAKTAFAEEIPTTIWSVNPTLVIPKQKQWEEQGTNITLLEQYPHLTPDQLVAAQTYHDTFSSTNFAHGLTDFHDEFFDLLVDSRAVHAHMPEEYDVLYEATIREMLRVLRPGGEIIVRDTNFSLTSEEKPQPRQVGMKERVLQRLGVQYTPIWKDSVDGNRVSLGAIITK